MRAGKTRSYQMKKKNMFAKERDRITPQYGVWRSIGKKGEGI